MQHATCNMQHATCNIHSSAPAVSSPCHSVMHCVPSSFQLEGPSPVQSMVCPQARAAALRRLRNCSARHSHLQSLAVRAQFFIIADITECRRRTPRDCFDQKVPIEASRYHRSDATLGPSEPSVFAVGMLRDVRGKIRARSIMRELAVFPTRTATLLPSKTSALCPRNAFTLDVHGVHLSCIPCLLRTKVVDRDQRKHTCTLI